MTRLTGGLLVFGTLLVPALTSGHVPTASPTARVSVYRPNILLVTLDTTRADVLGCFGGDPKVSPNLDRIAGRSHLFERAEASVPQTMPSHTTIFSGLHPFNHGVRKNLAVMVGPEVPLIAEELRREGYATGAFVSSFVVDGRFGFSRGFDHYDAPDPRPGSGDGMERRAAATVAAAIEWLADVVNVASRGIAETFDADGQLHLLRAAARDASDGDVETVMADLQVAVDRAARPGAAYRLRAAVRLRRLDDPAGALDDLEASAEWSLPADLGSLADDPRFERLYGDPRFKKLGGTTDGSRNPR